MKKAEDIPVITNISIESFFSRELAALSDAAGIPVKVFPVPYMEYRKYGDVYSKAGMIFVWLNLEGMAPDWQDGDGASLDGYVSGIKLLYCEMLNYISEISQAKVVIALLEDYFTFLPVVAGYDNDIAVDELNMRIQKELSGQVVFLDLMHMIASVGIGKAYSAKNRYRWGYPYSQALTKVVVAEVYKQYLIHISQTKKCVVVDCDNVLWGGILSEVGMEGLRLGGERAGKGVPGFPEVSSCPIP